MKKIFFVFSFLLCTAVFGQNTERESILKDIKDIAAALEKKDAGMYFDKIHPAFFEGSGKKEHISKFEAAASGSSDYKMNVFPAESEKIEISEVMKSSNGTQYAFVQMPLKMEMTFFKKLDGPYKSNLIKTYADLGLQPEFLSENTMLVTKKSLMIALKDKATDGQWKYLNFEPESQLLSKVAGKEILLNAAEYSANVAGIKYSKEKKPSAAPVQKAVKK